MKTLITLFTTLTLISCGGSNNVKANQENALTGAEITVLLTGKTATYTNSKGMNVENTFNADGSSTLKFLSGKFTGETRNNNWAIQGNELCYTIKRNNKTTCGKLIDNKNGTYNRLNANGSLRVVFKSVK